MYVLLKVFHFAGHALYLPAVSALLACGHCSEYGFFTVQRRLPSGLFRMPKQDPERQEQQLKKPNPPADQKPVQKTVDMPAFHCPAGSDTAFLHTLHKYIFTSAFWTSHFIASIFPSAVLSGSCRDRSCLFSPDGTANPGPVMISSFSLHASMQPGLPHLVPVSWYMRLI